MHARTNAFQIRPDRLEDGVRYFRGSVDELRGMPGFRRALLLVDRGSNQAMTLTLWESEAAVQATAERALGIVGGAAEYMTGQPERRTYEVALDSDAL